MKNLDLEEQEQLAELKAWWNQNVAESPGSAISSWASRSAACSMVSPASTTPPGNDT